MVSAASRLLRRLLLLLHGTWSVAQNNNYWAQLIDNIARSSLLNTAPGSTLERDVQALIHFFNNTCTTAQEEDADASNPYRGAFAQVSLWREQRGWNSIVQAHSDVAVQCRALYMEGGEEFVAKHCFWNIESLESADDSNIVYPTPRWTIVEDCCERLDRPVLRVRDAVWATTRGVGRAYRTATDQGAASPFDVADDYDYVPKLNCDQAVNLNNPDCDSTIHNVYSQTNARCSSSNYCPPSSKPIGIRSHHYFNAGLAVGDKGVIVRTLDGGYSWDCLRGCTRTGQALPDLNAISVNVRLGGFGYSQAYYSAQGTSDIDGIDWTLLSLEDGAPLYQGLDGVYWPVQAGAYLEGFAVGQSGSIIRIANGGVNGWDPTDLANPTPDPASLQEVTPSNADGTGGCTTSRNINDVFFWNMHLAFFVGDAGFLCRYGLEIQPENSVRGPGRSIDDVIDGTIALRWDSQGGDEQGLNWGRIIDNKDYAYSSFRAVFCLQIDDLDLNQWSAEAMDAGEGITYSQHITCFAAGTHPGTTGTTSAILRYESRAVAIGSNEDVTFREDVSWKPQNSRTSTPINDIYCVKAKSTGGVFVASDPIYCYAVGDNGLIRFTSNGGLSPWRTRFSSVLDNLRKVVIIEVTHTGGGNGDHAVVIGDNGRVLRTSDSGNSWQKLERVTPEHLVAIQFNAFDDFYYSAGGNDVSAEYNYFESSGTATLPFGNGIATGSVMYDWMSRAGNCAPDAGSPNTGSANNRFYDCRRPELSIVLRTNCQSTLEHDGSQSWRCRPECPITDESVPVALEDSLSSEAAWNGYFGTTIETVNNEETVVPRVPRLPGTALYARVSGCDEVWTIGHGRQWWEDTRETRLYRSAAVNPDTGEFLDFADVKAIRPAHEMCMYGWPRHKYGMTLGRRAVSIDNATYTTPTVADYTFLGRLRLTEQNCTLLGGQYYDADTGQLEDCVFEFGALSTCPSWEVHGMGHSLDAATAPVATQIPFVNFSVITDPCNDEWYGVTCEPYTADDALPGAVANMSITQIWLYSNNLQGRIPLLLSDLLSLRALSLGSNALIGTIPRDMWASMHHLKYLSLAENALEGTIPETLGNLSALEELRLHANRLGGGVPTELGGLGRLQSLSFHANRLEGQLPSALGALGSLQYLWFSSNNFTGALPSEIGKLHQLRYLWFANNSITSLPRELGELHALRSMDGSNNSIVDRLPYSFGKLRNLRVLRLGHNRLRATLPDALGTCTSLVLLELQHNELVGPVPASFGALEELTSLDLSHNQLERRLPYSIEGMHSLQRLLLQGNRLDGGLPPSVGTLRKLQRLNIADNRLTDALPDELAECGNLEELNLENNAIDGPLPAGIWRLQRLEYLLMTNNRLRGPLPEGLGYLAQIREMRLDRNLIDGMLPPTIGDASTLEIVRFDDNRLSGSIPESIGKLRNVLHLDMHQNGLVGDIPPQISGMESALSIYLHTNQLGGQIPPTIGNLTSLRELRVSTNRISGTIPPSLGKLGTLVNLGLDNNRIGGSIPAELGLLSQRLRTLQLQNNQLNGLLPTFLRLAQFRAVAIDLAGNPFWCPLPAWPALNGTASCVHCPSDVYLEDDHRTCSDHGVCMDGVTCRCDPMWEGATCDKLRCPSQCNGHGNCYNEREPAQCTLDSSAPSATAGMCLDLNDDCVAAYHDCAANGISIQVDSTGIVLAQEAKHNQIIFARCTCTDAYSGNDCSMDPLPPPTIEPWPDPYAGASAAPPSRRSLRGPGWTLLALALALLPMAM